MIAIVTDTTCDLPPDIVQEHHIKVVPLYLHFGDSTFRPGINLTNEEFLERLKSSPVLPTTDPPTIDDFLAVYERLSSTHSHIVSIHLSSQLGGTYTNAMAARDKIGNPNLHVVDSRSVSGGLGIITLTAARLAHEGQPLEAILKQVEVMGARHHIYLVADTLEYMHRGGRVGGAKALVGNLLGLKPILTLYEGKVEPVTAVASRSKAIARLRSMTINSMADGTHAQMGVFYTGVPDDARRLAGELSAAIKPDYMLVCEAGPIIAVYTGPNALGIFSYCDS